MFKKLCLILVITYMCSLFMRQISWADTKDIKLAYITEQSLSFKCENINYSVAISQLKDNKAKIKILINNKLLKTTEQAAKFSQVAINYDKLSLPNWVICDQKSASLHVLGHITSPKQSDKILIQIYSDTHKVHIQKL